MGPATRSLVLFALLAGHSGASRVKVSGEMEQWQGAMDAQKLSQLLTLGLDALTSSITMFTEDPPDIQAGFDIAQLKLWKVVTKIVPEDQQNDENMKAAKGAWDKAFEHAPDITEDVMEFRKTGNTDKLARALKKIVQTGLGGCSHIFPDEAKYFDALDDLIDGVCSSWDEFSSGNTEKAVEMIWGSVKASVDSCVPEAVANHDMYVLVMGTIDGTIGKMSEHVLDYKRRVLNSKVCYKRSTRRERTRPSVCRDGFEWDQVNLCMPKGSGNGADCLAACGGKGGMCESFCGRGKACCQQGSGKPEECEGAQGFVDHSFTTGSSWDYHQCTSPGPNLAFTVTGAGTSQLNGLYVQSGTHSGKPRYRKVHEWHTVMEWSKKRMAWRFFIDDTLFGLSRRSLYKSAEDSAAFPTSGWFAHKGLEPVPQLAPYVADASLAQVGNNVSLAEVSSALLPRLPWKGKPVYGSHPAGCDEAGEFTEKSGDWCMAPCPDGYQPSTGSKCVQGCGGKFPADSMGVCGRNTGELMIAMTEMVTMVASGALEAYVLVADMQKDGVAAEQLTKTIDVFIEMGKPFARPQCPVVVEAAQ